MDKALQLLSEQQQKIAAEFVFPDPKDSEKMALALSFVQLNDAVKFFFESIKVK